MASEISASSQLAVIPYSGCTRRGMRSHTTPKAAAPTATGSIGSQPNAGTPLSAAIRYIATAAGETNRKPLADVSPKRRRSASERQIRVWALTDKSSARGAHS